jgi:hypothetical protein
MSKISKDQAWKNIFSRYGLLQKIDDEGFVDITADEIKAVDGKEARLMCKVDFRENLPTIMSENGLSILAIKNGTYKISKNDPFIDVKRDITTQIIEIKSPTNILSIDANNIKSESGGLDIAYISGMLDHVFKDKSVLSIRGRLRGTLEFDIEKTHYYIDGVQIEVDGGYESKDAIHLIEAKIGFKNNINIRQLLYPQLFWEKEVEGKKEIRSYLFYLQDDIFRFIPYVYDGKIGYLDHDREMAFTFKVDKKDFSLHTIEVDQSMVDLTAPFPQADRFETINTMLIIISQAECISKEELKMEFDIVDRQIDYYFNVLKWLRVCVEVGNCLILTKRGKDIIDLDFKDRIYFLAKIVFSEPIMNDVLNDKIPSKDSFKKYNVNSQSTVERRLRTVRSWIGYFKKVLQYSK